MTIPIEKLLRHMAWANHQVFSKVLTLPVQALDAYAINPKWYVGEIIKHITSAGDGYGFRLTTEPRRELSAPKNLDELNKLIEYCEIVDDRLLRASEFPEAMIEVVTPSKKVVHARSTILSQAIHHATEHRAQLVSALEMKGYTSIDLDEYDLWAFMTIIEE